MEYWLLFCGMLVGGETVLLPAIYLLLLGKLQLVPLIMTATCATMLADSVWYLTGRYVPFAKLRRFSGERSRRALDAAAQLFARYGLKVVYCSKFVYGTRIATQVLAGIARLPYPRYLAVNAASILTWLGFLLLVSTLVHTGASAMNFGIHRAYLLLALLVPVVVLWRWLGRHFISRVLSVPARGQQERKFVPHACVSAIIPAFNEANTVVDVIRALQTNPAIDDIIVVDDGSTDDTVARVRTTSATLISMDANCGKAAAMAKGVERARHETIFFLDADLRGLTREIIDAILQPVLSGQFDMFVAIRDRRQLLLNKIVYFAPILGGERALTKSIWNEVPSWCVKSFQIEIALNYFSKRSGRTMGFALMTGLTHVKKEAKRGFWPGVWARARMYSELASIAFRLYVVESMAALFRKSGSPNFRRQPACPPS